MSLSAGKNHPYVLPGKQGDDRMDWENWPLNDMMEGTIENDNIDYIKNKRSSFGNRTCIANSAVLRTRTSADSVQNAAPGW